MTVEITRFKNFKNLRKRASSEWPDISYKGQGAVDGDPSIYDQIDEIIGPDVNQVDDYSQECYLGYLISEDLFAVGYDLEIRSESDTDLDFDWDQEDTCVTSRIYVFQLKDEELVVQKKVDFAGNFYHIGYNMTHELYPEIVDLRLD